MSKTLKDNAYLILGYKNLTPKARQALIKNFSNSQIKLVCEICENVLRKNIKVSSRDKKKLKKYKKLLYYLIKKKVGGRLKAKKLVQKGRGFFLPLLFSIVSPLVSSLLNKSK